MDSIFTVFANGKIYCVYCTKVLMRGEECHCKGAEKARAKAKEKAEAAARRSPIGMRDRRPPRGFSK